MYRSRPHQESNIDTGGGEIGNENIDNPHSGVVLRREAYDVSHIVV